jgi:hypothetical protein
MLNPDFSAPCMLAGGRGAQHVLHALVEHHLCVQLINSHQPNMQITIYLPLISLLHA